MTLKKKDQELVWDRIAHSWNIFRKKRPKDVEEFLKKHKGNILDIGCGSGRNFIKKEKTKVYAVDFSQEMVELAKKKSEKMKLQADIKKANSWDLKIFKDNFFDAVLFYAVLHCIDSPKKRQDSLKEIYRILKPNAHVFISTWGKQSKRIKEKESFIPWKINEEKELRYTYIYDQEELEDIVKKMGFKIIKSWEDENVNLLLKKE